MVNAFETTIHLSENLSIAAVNAAITNIEESSALAWFKMKESKILVVIPQPSKLGEAPVGTHEFAYGWLVRGSWDCIQNIASRLGMEIDPIKAIAWDPVTGAKKDRK